MAKTNTAAIQAALDTIVGNGVGSPSTIKVLKEEHDSSLYSRWYVTGHASRAATPAVILGPREKWCKTTVANAVGVQAAEIVTAFLDDTTAVNGNIDPDAMV